MTVRILQGDCREMLATLPDESVHCCVTSPPYYGLRDYGVDGQIGLEGTPEAYIETMVVVFRDVRRVLRSDGTLWLNIGDSYAGSWGAQGRRTTESDEPSWHFSQIKNHPKRASNTWSIRSAGLKPKDLMMIPARLALALQADGWWLRSEIVWAKKAPMPESVTDRPTCAHEKVFLLSKSARYFYDAEAVKEPCVTECENWPERATVLGRGGEGSAAARGNDRRSSGGFPPRRLAHGRGTKRDIPSEHAGIGHAGWHASMTRDEEIVSRNMRNIWHLGPEPFPEAHFATFPTEIPRRAILAGCPAGGVVFDPFLGAGTTALVADRLGRDCIGIELNPGYAAMAERRLRRDGGMFADVATENSPKLAPALSGSP